MIEPFRLQPLQRFVKRLEVHVGAPVIELLHETGMPPVRGLGVRAQGIERLGVKAGFRGRQGVERALQFLQAARRFL